MLGGMLGATFAAACGYALVMRFGFFDAQDPAAWISEVEWTVASGSMEPTLAGPRHVVHCEHCGFQGWVTSLSSSQPTGNEGWLCSYCDHAELQVVQSVDGERLQILDCELEAVRRGDLVAFENSKGDVQVKRVVGLPRERVTFREGSIVVDGRVWQRSVEQWLASASVVSCMQLSTIEDFGHFRSDSLTNPPATKRPIMRAFQPLPGGWKECSSDLQSDHGSRWVYQSRSFFPGGNRLSSFHESSAEFNRNEGETHADSPVQTTSWFNADEVLVPETSKSVGLVVQGQSLSKAPIQFGLKVDVLNFSTCTEPHGASSQLQANSGEPVVAGEPVIVWCAMSDKKCKFFASVSTSSQPVLWHRFELVPVGAASFRWASVFSADGRLHIAAGSEELCRATQFVSRSIEASELFGAADGEVRAYSASETKLNMDWFSSAIRSSLEPCCVVSQGEALAFLLRGVHYSLGSSESSEIPTSQSATNSGRGFYLVGDNPAYSRDSRAVPDMTAGPGVRILGEIRHSGLFDSILSQVNTASSQIESTGRDHNSEGGFPCFQFP